MRNRRENWMFLSMRKCISLITFTLTLVMFVFFQSTQAAEGEEIRVNSISEHSQMHPTVAANDKLVAVAWQSDANYFHEIMCAVSTDGGKTFAGEVRVAGAERQIHRDPVVAVGAGGEIYVVWQAVVDDRDYDIFISVSGDGGKTFNEPVRVNSHKEGNQQFPAVDVSREGDIWVVWHDNSRGPEYTDIYIDVSDDGGKTFPERMLVYESDGVSLWPDVGAGPDFIAAVWESGGTVNVASPVAGTTSFSAPFSPPGRDEKGEWMFPRAAVSDAGLHAVFTEKRGIQRPPNDNMYRHPGIDHDIYYSFMPADNPDSEFSSPVKVSTEKKGNQLRPDVVEIDSGVAAVAWFDGRETGDYDIYIAAGGPGGFRHEQRVNTTLNSDSRNPRLAVSGDSLLVIWQDDAEGNYDIYLSKISIDDLR